MLFKDIDLAALRLICSLSTSTVWNWKRRGEVRIDSLEETPKKMCLRNKEREGMSEDDAGGPFGSHACELSALLSYVEDHTGSGKNFPQYELWSEFQAESPIMGTLGTCSPLGRNPKILGSPKTSWEPWAPPGSASLGRSRKRSWKLKNFWKPQKILGNHIHESSNFHSS